MRQTSRHAAGSGLGATLARLAEVDRQVAEVTVTDERTLRPMTIPVLA
jgi:hypothetical protein